MSVADQVIECSRDVNASLGPGFRENAYQQAMVVCLSEKGLSVTQEATIPVLYRDKSIARMHPDLIVGDSEVYLVELKVDGSGEQQLARYLDQADRNEIVHDGGIVISFGDTLEYSTL